MSDESPTDGASFQDPVWSTDVECRGVKYTVSVDESQRQRAAFLIKPKPVKNDANEDRVLSDHRDSVRNVAMIINLIMLRLMYLIEIACDYLATVYGRADAGRGFDILPPETHVDAWEGLKATLFIHWTGIGTVSPEPAPLPGVQSEWRDGA